MALPIKPRVQVPAQELIFSASPYIGTEIWVDGLRLFHGWMADHFSVGDAFADYVLAEALNVHRCISDCWLFAALQKGYLTRTRFFKGSGEVYAGGFIIEAPAAKMKVDLKISKELLDFDPWTDRTLDKDVPDAIYADYYIDKFFDVFVNEYYFYTGYMRKRPNGKTFSPVDHTEHPRHANSKTSRAGYGPPPIEWRRTIDRLAEI